MSGPSQGAGTISWIVARRALLIFLPLVAVAGTVFFLVYREAAASSRAEAEASQNELIAIGREIIAAELGSVASDLGYLSEEPALQRWIAAGEPADRAAAAAAYRRFARHQRPYSQVRFIDIDGVEQIRINRDDDAATIVDDADLQDKSRRDYVRGTLALERGQIYVSPFDLNREHGVVEEPPQPVLRYATAVFDADGRRRGLVIVNFLGRRLLERLRALSAERPSELWLVNADGYWLAGPRPEDEWGFMYPERAERSFAFRYPMAWRSMRESMTSDSRPLEVAGSLFTYTQLSPLDSIASQLENPALNSGPWLLVAHLSGAALDARVGPVKRRLGLAATALAIVLAFVSWNVARQWSSRIESQRALARSEEKARSLLESAPDGVVVTNSAGTIVLVNAQTEKLFGYRREQLVGQSIDMLVPARHRVRHADFRTSYVYQPRLRPMGAGLELAGVRSDGTEFPVAISLSPIQDGVETLVFSDIRDTTRDQAREREIRRLNAQLRHDNAALLALNEELRSFSYSVSHDLRAPLRAVDGFSQALLEDYAARLDSSGRDYLDRIRRAAQRMGHLIDDLLKLSRITRSELELCDVDLSALAREVAAELAARDGSRDVDVVIASGLRTTADPRMLRIALQNLLGNALKFTTPRPKARIEVGATGTSAERVYFVRDNGVGFDMAYADKLFGAFQRLHGAGEFPGTGIGLAIVQRVIRRHGGEIWAESAPDGGATFYFRLGPAAEAISRTVAA